MTKKQLEFLEAVAYDRLPKYNTLGALRRMANRLIREGWLSETSVGKWTKYSLTEAGNAALRDAWDSQRAARIRAEDAELHRRNMITG